MGNTADLQLGTDDPVGSPAPAVCVDVALTPVLSSALAHNAVPVVSRVTLTSADRSLPGVTLRMSVQDAEGAMGTAVERLVDLEAGRPAVLDDLGLALDPAAMLQVEERRAGWVRVELADGDRVLVQQRVPVHVLATAQWLATPLPLALELLAAHVQPDHPAVPALLAEAAELLEQGTGDGSIAGYADGAERVDEVVEAVTWAMRRREIRVLEPPASWTDLGQQVRTPGEVLDGRAGTPLDTVVTLAAALERAGIRPLLWIVSDGAGREHAFLGYWREERSAATAATTDVAALVELVDQGVVRLVETVLLTDRGDSRTDLHGPAHAAWLTGDLSGVLGVTDVHRARLDGVLPLPADACAASSHTSPTTEPVPAPEPAESVPAESVPATADRLQQWQDALLDLGPGNPLIDHTRRAGLPLTVPHDSLAVLEDLVSNGAAISLLPAGQTPPGPRSVAVDAPDHVTRLRDLAHRARTAVEEAGANDLYLTLGTLVWELDGRALRSPLVLLPVVLTVDPHSGGYRITADEAGAATPNGYLLEQLSRRHGLTVPGLATTTEDGAGLDLTGTLQAVRAVLAAHSLPWRVEPTAELAVLPFAAFRRWQDLAEHRAELATNPLLAHLRDHRDEPFADPASAGAADLDALAAQCPLPADAAQLRAVAEALAGRTFVLEGPPGTGKSQTITNLVTRAVAEGKRVLVVAAKRAALDVVARRLDAVGMGPFALDLHARGSRPAVVRAQIRAALDHAVEVDDQGLAADAEDLRSASASLQRYAERLHAPNPAGLSFWSAHSAVLAAGSDVDALPVTRSFAARADADVVTAVRRALALLPDIAGLARPSAGHAWGFLDTVELDITAVQQAAAAVDAAIRDLPGEGGLAAAVRAARTPEELDTLVHLLTGPRVSLDVLDEVRSRRWAAATADMTAETAALVGADHPGFAVVTPEVLRMPLADLSAAVQSAGGAGWLARRGQLAAVRDQLAPVLRPGANLRTKDVPALIESLGRVQSAVHHIAAGAATIPGLQVPPGWNPFLDSGRFLLEAEVRWLRRAAAAVDGTAGFAGALRRFLAAGPVADPASAAPVVRLRDVVVSLLDVCSSDSAQLDAWCGEHGLVLRWAMTRPERGVEYVHPMSLRRWVSLLDTLEPLRLAGLTEARAQLRNGLVAAEDAVRAFDRGLAEASAAERAGTTGLDAFDPHRHERAISRFAAASRAVRSHLTAALPAGMLAARPASATGDGDQVAALRRELAEQRHGLGVRGLLAEHGDVITTVLPCVLAGPDSVARFLPATAGLFDLVVFDEASQLRVADAVGALGRARAAVVVGDSAQLPPASSAEDDEESLLSACVQAGVPRQWLSWHYRSQDESLIAFSNAHYYAGRLASFPAPGQGRASAAPGGRGVSLVQVGGTFLRSGAGLGTNPVEAQTLVAEVRRRFAGAEGTPPSIAVVTVHPAQRRLIEALLRDSGDARVIEALDRTDGEGLLVKDLAHVQGDERDVVFLSTGASPDRVPLDLGPLDRAGGERWLNVAITRARRQVVVVTSLTAGQLPAEETAPVGVRHLRGYLDLAARGTDALPRSPRAAGDRHAEQIAAGLRERGLVVRTDVGLSEFRIDLTVARADAPDTPLMAVLLDGPAWARRSTVGDRDGLPVEVLGERLGWPAVERVWLPTWLAGPDDELDRLVAVVEAVPPPVPVVEEPAFVVVAPAPVAEPEPADDAPLAEVIPLRPAAPAPEPEPVAPEPVAAEPVAAEPVDAEPVPAPARRPRTPAAPLDGELRFTPWAPRPAGDKKQLDRLADPAVAKVVRRVLAAGLKAEGPVHRDRLTRLTAAAFGLTRVTEARRDVLLTLLPKGAVVDGDVVWPAGLDRASWRSFRRQASSGQRPLEHVPPEELGNALVALAAAGAGLPADELYAQTLAVFGVRRRSPALLPLLEAALAAAVAAGRLTEQPDGTVTA